MGELEELRSKGVKTNALVDLKLTSNNKHPPKAVLIH